MGSVHQQTVNEGRGCQEFYNVSLSDLDVVKSLIINRYAFDSCFDSKYYHTSHPCISNGIPLFQEPVEVLYLDLENLLSKINATHKELELIELLMLGYDFESISFRFGWDEEKVKDTFDFLCRKIRDQNNYDWKTCLEINGMVRIPSDVFYKKCTSCKRDLRTSNFGSDSRNKDGFKSICKKCDSYTKKIRKNG